MHTLLYAQLPDSLNIRPANSIAVPDTLPGIVPDTALTAVATDTVIPTRKKGAEITAQIDYNSADSLVFSNEDGSVEMFNTGKIVYGDITLEAAYIKYNMSTGIVLATGLPDSTGKVVGKPEFKEGDQAFKADTMWYNFKSQKARISNVITEQEGGFLHSEETKRQSDGHIHLKNGKYTTCDLEHPHFFIAITKGISIPGEKIVSGPAYLVLQDVPLPIGIPFGFFPNSRTKSSGIVIPQYGEETTRGFYLRDGGYYFAMNDYMDLRLTGDIYSNGTWGAKIASSYKVNYKFSGSVRLSYYNNVEGYKDIEGLYDLSKDYSIAWSHNQDSKANPNSTFRASVNLSSSGYDKNHSTSLTNVMTNTKASSISYTKSWPGTPFNMSASLNQSQNSNTQAVNLSLPKVTFTMSKVNPFKRKKSSGPKKWYEDIQLSYTSLLENDIKTTDTALFTSAVWNDMKNGFKHEIPLSLSIKPFKKSAALQTFSITPNLSYKGMLYTRYLSRQIAYYDTTVSNGNTTYTPVFEDTLINKLSYAHSYLPSIGTSIAPKIYGFYEFKGDGRLRVIRHVMTPSASMSFTPDMNSIQPDYYRTIIDEVNDTTYDYSIYEDEKYGTPTFNGANGSLSLSLRNNLDAKIKSKSDTIDELEKLVLLDKLNFSTSMNIFQADRSVPRWNPVSFTGSTALFKNKMKVQFNGAFDPFGMDSTHNRINTLYFNQTGRFVRLTKASLSFGMNFESKKSNNKEGEKQSTPATGITGQDVQNPTDQDIMSDVTNSDAYGGYVDFNVPWSLKVNYSFSYAKPRYTETITQTVNFQGDFSLSSNWKIGFNTGYDFHNKQITTSNISLYRDLHCWEMRMSIVPFGTYKSYSFTIAAKSSILSDLKYDKRKSWTDNFR